MEISKGLQKISLSNYDLTKNSSLNEIFGELQDYCSDNDQNIVDFKKFKMIITQVNAFKELTESQDHSKTINLLIRKIETLGLDNSTAKWAVKIVADSLSIKNNLSFSNSTPSIQPKNQTQTAVIKKAVASRTSYSSNKIQQVSKTKPTYQAKPKINYTPKQNYAPSVSPSTSRSLKSDNAYSIVSIISFLITLSLGGVVIAELFTSEYLLWVLVGVSVFNLIGFLVNEEFYVDHAMWLFLISLVLSIYILLYYLGFGLVYSLILILGVFSILVSIGLAVDDSEFSYGSWLAVSIGLSLINVALIGGNVYSDIWAKGITMVLALIALISGLIANGDYEEGFGITHIILSLANLGYFIAQFFI